MSEKPPETPADLARQLAQHVDSLRAGGVEWVPSQPLPETPPATRPATTVAKIVPAPTAVHAPVAAQTSLFAAAPVEPVVAGDGEQRRQALTVLAKEVAGCVRCPQLASTRTQTVFGVGPIDPELCFVGEAPGADEDRLGEPFVGAAGQLLTRIIAAMGMKREEVYICNILRCRPPGNRPPEPDEAAHCSEWLEKTLELVRPKFICALGNTPLKYLLGIAKGGITKLRGRFFEWRGIPVMLTFHPSYLLRQKGAEQAESKKQVWEDMKTLLQRMGRPIPGKE
jgi:DNA polymerase